MRRILCYGDSNTYGYDPSAYLGGRYPEDVRWTGLLKRAGWVVVNEGQNGREIPTREWEIQAAVRAVERAAPLQVIAVMLGTNDLLQNPAFKAEDVTERMERFLRNILPNQSDERVLLLAPPPMRPGEWVCEARLLTESARLSGCYRRLAETLGVGFADAGEWNVEVSFDGVHFSEAGHAAFAEGLRKRLGDAMPC